jgi:5-hydroxyisourate hydrolase
MSRITTHVLDTALGKPARDLKLRLAVREPGGEFTTLAERVTNDDGRAPDLSQGVTLEPRTYRLSFETGPYLEATHGRAFYPSVDVIFAIEAIDQHHHIPLLLSPYGYSTYRGS